MFQQQSLLSMEERKARSHRLLANQFSKTQGDILAILSVPMANKAQKLCECAQREGYSRGPRRHAHDCKYVTYTSIHKQHQRNIQLSSSIGNSLAQTNTTQIEKAI
jgi:hypothetical protein